MKKVSIITIHVGFNFGSILQTIASTKVFRDLGCDPIVVNYIPRRVTYLQYFKDSFCSLFVFLRRMLALPNVVINKHIYQGYLKKYARVSKPIYSSEDFKKSCPAADIYVTGSDQVWNTSHNEGLDSHYFYDGINGYKISYASSIGKETLNDEEKFFFRSELASYYHISVREASAVRLMREIGIEAVQLIDPTFMLDKNEWCQYMGKRKIRDPYLLVYLPYNIVDESLIYNDARRIAAKRKLKIVTFTWSIVINRQADITVKYASPGDFLSLIYYADVVLTNSFHGTAFSINLNKEFWTYSPSAFATRIKSILSLCHLSNRFVENRQHIDLDTEKIDYTQTNMILVSERQRAISFLKDSIN